MAAVTIDRIRIELGITLSVDKYEFIRPSVALEAQIHEGVGLDTVYERLADVTAEKLRDAAELLLEEYFPDVD